MIRANKLNICYDDKLVLKDLSFTVAPGEIFCLLGPNGAGKTTIINTLLGDIEPISGTVLIDGVSTKEKSVRNSVVCTTETIEFYGHFSGLDNLDHFSRSAGFIYTKEALIGLLKKVNLNEEIHLNRLVTYSKEMRQKLGIALALAKKVPYIFMDEPISGLDVNTSTEFSKICKRLSVEGIGMLLTTHNVLDAINISSKIGIMGKGTLIDIVETSKITEQELQELYIKNKLKSPNHNTNKNA